ncbi:MAG TPA: SpoIID/LytB domain-containing protein, partial [Mobilitalea sp.]|nr:SpoIID/LytB domain-containing protein [Mobilitalea sp.]
MSIKRKLILIGICIAIILVVFTVNVIRQMKKSSGDVPNETVVNENVITRAEAYRLLSYLEYDKTHREAIPVGITYADQNMSDWYDTYVNAVWKMGLIEGNVTITPKGALTYGSCKELIDKLITQRPEFQNVYTNLSFNFVKADDDMLIPQFLELYGALLNTIPKNKVAVKEMKLFVLGQEVTDDGIDRMVTDQGKFYYKDLKDYENYFEQMQQSATVTPVAQNVTNTENDISTSDSTDASKDSTKNDVNEGIINTYLDKSINTLVCGQEIIYITSVTTEKTVIRNVWIEQGEDQQVDSFVSGINKSFHTEYPLESPIEKVVGDITIENQKIIHISVKPDLIKGKVLLTGEDFIEIEGYGKVPLDDDFKIYKIYGDLSMEPTSSILVGYKTTDFVVSGGKISAALIKESIKAENIRVLLKTTDFKAIYHPSVELSSSVDSTIKSKDKETKYKAGDKVTVKPGDELLNNGRITVTPNSDNGKIQILSIERSSGNPKYRGTIEISEDEKGLLVVNELPLEEYLYAVIPSEMPTYYGAEALKVQAVCARSYA